MPDFDSSCQARVILPNRDLRTFPTADQNSGGVGETGRWWNWEGNGEGLCNMTNAPQQQWSPRHLVSPLSRGHPCQDFFPRSHSTCAKSDANSALICAYGVCFCSGKLHQNVDAHWCVFVSSPSLVCVHGSPRTEITSWKWGWFGISSSLHSNSCAAIPNFG